MEETRALAVAFGTFTVGIGLSMAVQPEGTRTMYRELMRNRVYAHTIGIVLFLIGCILTAFHTRFSGLLSTGVTLVGWMILLEGCVYLFLPVRSVRAYVRPLLRPNPYLAVATGYVVVGAFLYISALLGIS